MRMQLERYDRIPKYSTMHEFYTPLYEGIYVCVHPTTMRVTVSYETSRHVRRYRRQGGRLARLARRYVQEDGA